jgi:hypothetical protein
MRFDRFFYCRLLFAICVWQTCVQAEDRLWVEAAINGKPVHLAFDTGSDGLVLFEKAVGRLGLSYTNAPKNARVKPGQVPTGETEECDLQLFGNSGRKLRTSFRVYEIPPMLRTSVDGVVGWLAFRADILMIDARQGVVSNLTSIPADITNWAKFKILTSSGVLRLELPKRGGRASTIFVDTGDEKGVALSPDLWEKWNAAHTNQPMTLDSYYTPYAGIVVIKEFWARKLAIGELLLKDVPIREADQGQNVFGSMTLGLAALNRLDFILDTKRGFAYLRSKDTPPPLYEYNRLGAVFTPVDLQSEALIAQVLRDSPGWKAGIRNGDVLTRIGNLDVTNWRTDPAVSPSRFCERPAGTRIELTLRRGKEEFKTEVVLQEILSTETGSSGNLWHE